VKQQTAARLAWSVWAATLALLAAALVLAAANQGARPRLGDDPGLAFAFLCFATVGAFIASRRQANAVGWICCAIGLTVSLAVAPIEYGHYAWAHPGSLPAAATVAWPRPVLAGVGPATANHRNLAHRVGYRSAGDAHRSSAESATTHLTRLLCHARAG
jgi:hypothetical protein